MTTTSPATEKENPMDVSPKTTVVVQCWWPVGHPQQEIWKFVKSTWWHCNGFFNTWGCAPAEILFKCSAYCSNSLALAHHNCWYWDLSKPWTRKYYITNTCEIVHSSTIYVPAIQILWSQVISKTRHTKFCQSYMTI